MRMLIVGYCYGIRSERKLCEEVSRHLAYRWFRRLDLDDAAPDHSTFSRNRHGRFRDSDLLRLVFERVVGICLAAGLIKGEGFAVDASVIEADASRYHGLEPEKIDNEHAIIVDVEPPPARTFEVRSTATMLERTQVRIGLKPKKLAADTAYGTGRLLGWLVGQAIEPHIPVWDKGSRDDGTFGRSDFILAPGLDQYTCPAGKILRQFRRNYSVARRIQEEARDQARLVAGTPQFATSRNERKKVEMLFGHLKATLRFERMRLRGRTGARDEFHPGSHGPKPPTHGSVDSGNGRLSGVAG
ncbi:transposase, partial [Microvirga makkahensis]|nr:transposase [Microvirga makkahensis]